MRAEVLTLKEPRLRHGVAGDRGRAGFWIMRKHLFPNVVNTVVIIMTLEIAIVILAEAALSFLTGRRAAWARPSWGVA